MAQVRPDGHCWGSMARCLGYCYKKPREGALTCWSHRNQELQAQHMKDKAAALERAKAKWGKDAHVEFSRTAPYGSGRKKFNEDLALLLKTPKEERTPEQTKRIKQLRGMLISYRCSVGFTTNVGFHLFHVKGQGDTWDEAFAKADENK